MRYEKPVSEDGPIWDIWLSMHRLPSMAVADELGVFQALDLEPATSAEVAAALGFNQRATDILLCMLASLGLLSAEAKRYALTDVTRTYLLPRSEYYWGPLLRVLGVLPKQHEA